MVTSSACGATISYNSSYITNPGYPSSYSTANTCSWTFEKSQSDVCMIRLDFEALTLAAPQSGTNPNTSTNPPPPKTKPPNPSP